MFKSRRTSAPAIPGTGFRAMGASSSRPPRHHWPLSAILSCLFALAGLRYTIHDWHHPSDRLGYAAPLLAIAIAFGAWNRLTRNKV